MKKYFFAIFSLILLLSVLICSCDVRDGSDPIVTTTAATTQSIEPEEDTSGGDKAEEKKDAPKFDEIDLSDANIANFEPVESVTDYVIISVAGYGDILVRLFPEVAPKTVNNFKKLVSDKFYDGLIFHRVIENFVIQGGGFDSNMAHKESNTIKGEFNSNGFENNLLHVEGVISMARTSVKDSATSQFFIMHKVAAHLDGEYAAFGYAADGRDVVDAIAKCNTDNNNQPIRDVIITSIRFAAEKEGIVGPLPSGPEGSTTMLERAKDYLYNVMKDKNGKALPNDYDVVGKIIIEETSFEVTWKTDNDDITIKESSKANMWTVDLPDVNTEEITYTLTATIKAEDGSTIEVSFTPKLPVIDNTGITTTPEEGVAYKLFFEQVNLGYTLYALNTTQDGKNKFIEATLDPKEAADFYVEKVDGGYKIYTEIDGVKNYVNATATPRTDGGTGFTKAIGFATESDSVFFYDAYKLTFMVTIAGQTFGVGTYNAFETISISENTYFKNDNINVAGGQFPIGFMTSAYAETLDPDEKPVSNNPEANSVLTIAQAIELGKTKTKDQYTTGKYYVTGVITSITSDVYGNMMISDGTNEILVYGTFDATGANRFDKMANQPKVGDTVTVYGVVGMYNDAQLKNAWITKIVSGEGGDQGGDQGGENPAYVYTVVDAPVAGTAYKFGMVQANVQNKVFYLAGGMAQTYYLATTEEGAAGIDVYLETTDGGYYLYTMVGETKTYINMVVSGTHVNGAYEATASTVYTYDAESKTIIASVTVGDAEPADYWFGTRNDKTYTTVGPCATSYEGFYCQFYALTEVEGGEAGGEVTPPEGGDETDGPANSVVIADYATANSWANGTLYDTLNVGSDVTVTLVATPVGQYGQNTGKYYTSDSTWRIYQNENPSITITAAGKTITSVKITYTPNRDGVLLNGDAQVASDAVVTVNAESITFGVGNGGDATNGQVRITAIEVIYE